MQTCSGTEHHLECGGDTCLPEEYEEWQHHAIENFDFVLTGGHLESFWEELLP